MRVKMVYVWVFVTGWASRSHLPKGGEDPCGLRALVARYGVVLVIGAEEYLVRGVKAWNVAPVKESKGVYALRGNTVLMIISKAGSFSAELSAEA
ncbi:hypothetical protein WG66_013943 [Moniliophthora roreri]|nr:hypothetical protein WG66_013943 [Moniliophthora roreri]